MYFYKRNAELLIFGGMINVCKFKSFFQKILGGKLVLIWLTMNPVIKRKTLFFNFITLRKKDKSGVWLQIFD